MGIHQKEFWVKPLGEHFKDRGRLAFVAALGVLGGVFFVLAVLAGYRLLNSGHFWPPDVLLGFDVSLNIDNMTQPHFNSRNNVHPLFAFLIKPLGLLVIKTGFVTRGVAAILVNAAFGVLGLWLTAWYLRLRRVGRLDTFLLVLVMAGSIGWICQSAIPSSPCFSLCVIALTHILLVWTLRQPDATLRPVGRWGRNALWVISGVVNYGLTVTNGFLSFLTYGFSRTGLRGWARAVVYGALVLGLGMASAWMVGSSLDLILEKHFVVDHETHGAPLPYPGFMATSTSLVWSFVAPNLVQTISADARAVTCSVYLEHCYTATGWALLVAWMALVCLGAWAVWRESEPQARRCNHALLAGLVFIIVLHRFYNLPYEGVFFWGGHSLFLVLGLFASLFFRMRDWPSAKLNAMRLALLALGLVFFVRHFLTIFAFRETIPLPPGYGG